MPLVTITPKTDKVTCAAGQSVDYVFGVYNSTPGNVRVSVETLGELKDKKWAHVAGNTELDLSVKGQQEVTVKVAVPADAAAANYTFQLRVYDVTDPERSVESTVMTVEVPAAVVPADDPPVTGNGPNWGLIFGLIGGGVVLLIGIGVLIFFMTRPGTPDTVPRVVDQALDQAIEGLKAAGLEVGDVFEELSGSAEPGIVLRQDPEGGTAITDNKVVALTIEAISTQVPDVRRKPLSDAIETILSAGLARGGLQKKRSNAPGGTVIDQNPPADAGVLPGTPVDLVIAEEAILVPDVTGKTVADAQTILKRANLRLGKVSERTEGGTAGIVLSHTPSGGKEAEPGDAVSLLVRAQTVVVPPVENQTYQAAKEQIEQLGLRVKASYSLTKRHRAGTVFKQNPRPNTRVSVGSTVSLSVEQRARTFSAIDATRIKPTLYKQQINKIYSGQVKIGRGVDDGEGMRIVTPDEPD